jgi:hypothetical protein
MLDAAGVADGSSAPIAVKPGHARVATNSIDFHGPMANPLYLS